MAESQQRVKKKVRFAAMATNALIGASSAQAIGGTGAGAVPASAVQEAALPAGTSSQSHHTQTPSVVAVATESLGQEGTSPPQEMSPTGEGAVAMAPTPTSVAPPNFSPDSTSSASSWGTISPCASPSPNASSSASVSATQAVQPHNPSTVTPELLCAFKRIKLSLRDGILNVDRSDTLLRRFVMGPPFDDGILTFTCGPEGDDASSTLPFELSVLAKATTTIKDVYDTIQRELMAPMPSAEWARATPEQKLVAIASRERRGRTSDRRPNILRADLLGRPLENCVIEQICAATKPLCYTIIIAPLD